MRFSLPHDLGREEVRRRLKERSHEIADHIPGGMASVDTQWQGEDRMQMVVSTMGQDVRADIDIDDNQVVIQLALPPALSFFEPIVESAIKSNATKLLEKK